MVKMTATLATLELALDLVSHGVVEVQAIEEKVKM